MTHLDFIAKNGWLPFELDLFRELGYRFGEDWDGELLIEPPRSLDVEAVTKLIARFSKGIKTRLHHEGVKSRTVCVGGPMNGQPYDTGCIVWQKPILFHLKRCSWAVYFVKGNGIDDPRAWFVGLATSKRKARQLWIEQLTTESEKKP